MRLRWSVPLLFAHPEGRFSHVESHYKFFLCPLVCSIDLQKIRGYFELIFLILKKKKNAGFGLLIAIVAKCEEY